MDLSTKYNNDGGMTFPNPFVHPKYKDYKYIMAYGKAMYNTYLSLNTNIGYINRSQYELNRMFVLGVQDIEQYRSQVDILDGTDGGSYLNIDWGQLPVLHKPYNIFKGLMGDMSHRITAQDLSPLSIDTKTQAKLTELFNFKFKDQLTAIAESMGQESPKPSRFKSEEDIELFYKNDYKLDTEIVAVNAWNIIADTNDWDNEINQQMASDLFTTGLCGTRDYVDSNGVIRVRRIKPDNLVTGWSDRYDYKDCPHFGEILFYTIAQLREAASSSPQQILEHEWEKLAKSMLGLYMNPLLMNGIPNNQATTLGRPYDGIRVPVLDFEFESVNRYEYESSEDKNGNKMFIEIDPDLGTLEEDAVYNKKRVRKDIKVLYTGKWIIGTDLCFDAGLAQNLKRRKNSLGDVMSNFHVYAPSKIGMRVKSLAEMCIPYINNIHIAWYKFQAAVASASPKGLAIDIAAVSGIIKGEGETWQPLDIIELRKATGTQLYRSRDENGQVIGNGRLPIEEIENGMSADTFRFLDIIARNQQMIYELIGFNDISAGSNPNPEVGKAQSQMAMQSTNNALKPLITAYSDVLVRTAKSCIQRLQDISKNKMKGYIQALGESSMAILGAFPDMSLSDFAISIQFKPNEEDLAILNQFIQRELSVKADGMGGGLTVSDAFAVFDVMKVNPKEAAVLLDKRKEDNDARYQQQQQANSEANSQAQAQASMQAQQMAMQMQLEMEKQKMSMKAEMEGQLTEMIETMKTERQAMMDDAALEREMLKAEKDIFVAEMKANAAHALEIEHRAIDTIHLLESQEHEKEVLNLAKPKEVQK